MPKSTRRGATSRRAFLTGCASSATCGHGHPAKTQTAVTKAGPKAGIMAGWQSFRDRFLMPDGRIVDTGNGGISHSEGQGWGMLFAVAADDRDSFERIFAWTSSHLTRPDDALHFWRYDPAAQNPVSDPNNAADGDVFIAWALARAAQSWGQPALAASASLIAAAIRDRLCLRQSGRVFLLPGVTGFATPKAIILNPSYYVLPAFKTLATLAPSGLWPALWQDGLKILQQGVFGRWALPPDWLSVNLADLSLSPAASWPPRFGFDAIRVPLWLTWARIMPPGLGHAFTAYFETPGLPYRPAWVDLKDGDYAGFPASPGMAAIAALTLAATRQEQAVLPDVSDSPDYYSAALTLLSCIAQAEINQ